MPHVEEYEIENKRDGAANDNFQAPFEGVGSQEKKATDERTEFEQQSSGNGSTQTCVADAGIVYMLVNTPETESEHPPSTQSQRANLALEETKPSDASNNSGPGVEKTVEFDDLSSNNAAETNISAPEATISSETEVTELSMVKHKKKGESFVISFSDKPSSGKQRKRSGTLQDSFKSFQQQKMDQMKQQKKLRRAQRRRKQLERAKPQNMWNLRMRFLCELKKYIGVPYAKRYFQPGEPEYDSKIFLDCCGLVRKALYDLQYLFGFRIGPWNQAYMFDTLPIDIADEKDMKPGDLVFISGIYNEGSKFKNSPHNMKHVEVWLGKGQKVLGSRWQRGTVSVFDSYRFESKAYHSMEYHFKSIDTWLKGICKSYCKEHPWRLKQPAIFSDKSIFSRKINKGDRQNKQNVDKTKKVTKKKTSPKQSRSKLKAGDENVGAFENEDETVSEEVVNDFDQMQLDGSFDAETEIDQLEGAEECLNDGMGQQGEDEDEEDDGEDLDSDVGESESGGMQQHEEMIGLDNSEGDILSKNPFDDIE